MKAKQKKAKRKSVLAWHWLQSDGNMRYANRPPDKVEKIFSKPRLCQWGLHASERLIDAKNYAPGDILCRVRCSGKIEHAPDKLVCTRREILWSVRFTQRDWAKVRKAYNRIEDTAEETLFWRLCRAGIRPGMTEFAAIMPTRSAYRAVKEKMFVAEAEQLRAKQGGDVLRLNTGSKTGGSKHAK